jgi:hypothetical protein
VNDASGNVAIGGTSLTVNGVAVPAVAPGTTGNVLTSNGSAWTSAAPAGTGVNVQSFTGSGTWTKPAYSASSRVLIQCWGGGGSGGKGSAVGATAAGGGGYNERWITLSAMGATETITIGAGGVAVTAIGPGNAGGTTSVGSLISAYGGGAGISGNGGGGGGGQLSAGSRGDVRPAEFAASAGTLGFPGAPWPTIVDTNASASAPGMGGQQTSILTAGTNGFPAHMHGGGGGGASGTTGGAGGASVYGGGGGGGAGSSTAGAGGASSFGGSGGAGSLAGNGTAGTQPGGGGGATRSGTSTGAGGAGQVIITVFPA